MNRWKKWGTWIGLLVVIALVSVALLGGSGNAANYVKDSYPLVDVAGKGKAAAKVYEASNKTVPEVAKELAAQDQPKEVSKDNPDQMFLVYDNRIINLQKDPENASNTLIEINTIEYAKEHYDSSFLEGFVTAAILQSIFSDSGKTYTSTPYKGYSTSSPSKSTTSTTPAKEEEKKPTTSDRTGSFTTKGADTPSSTPAASGSSGSSSSSTKPSTSSGSTSSSSSSSTSKPSSSSSNSSSSKTGSTGNWSTSNSSSSKSSSSSSAKSSSTGSNIKKSDGSTPSTKSKAPSTSSRTGSFTSKKR